MLSPDHAHGTRLTDPAQRKRLFCRFKYQRYADERVWWQNILHHGPATANTVVLSEKLS